MIDVAVLKPSEIERLSQGSLEKNDAIEIIASLRRMLTDVTVDGGADSDRIYMMVQMLDMASVWHKISPSVIAYAVHGATLPTTRLFISSLPHDIATEISYRLVQDDFLPGRDLAEKYLSEIEIISEMINHFENREDENLEEYEAVGMTA